MRKIKDLTTEQIKALEPAQIKALKSYQIQALITNILMQSYNLSDKTLNSFQSKLDEYKNIPISEEDAKKAFLGMKFVAKGEKFTEDHLATLASSRTWFEFIEKLITDLFNLFRTEKQESIGAAKGNFQSFIKTEQSYIDSTARAA